MSSRDSLTRLRYGFLGSMDITNTMNIQLMDSVNFNKVLMLNFAQSPSGTSFGLYRYFVFEEYCSHDSNSLSEENISSAACTEIVSGIL